MASPAPIFSPAACRAGAVLVLLLSALPLRAQITYVSPGPVGNGDFGLSTGFLGDVTGDGRADILIGAPGETVSGFGGSGRVHVFDGSTGALVRTFNNPSPEIGADFGFSVAGVGNVDGAGGVDVLIGAPDANNGVGGAVDAGRAYVMDVATGGLVRTLVSPNPEVGGAFGHAVAFMIPSGPEPAPQLAIGAPSEDGGATDAGRVYVFRATTGALTKTVTSSTPEVGGGFGFAVADGLDADYNSIVIGAPFENGGATDAGRVYVYVVAAGGFNLGSSSPNPTVGGNLGFSVAGPTSIGGAGFNFLVGAPGEAPGPLNGAGRAYMIAVNGGSLLHTFVSPTLTAFGSFGNAVANTGDVTGDGVNDVLVGAPFEDVPFTNAGRAYVFNGSTGVLVRRLASRDPEANGHFGFAVSRVGDTGGDGRSDLLVGAEGESTTGFTDNGVAYLFKTQTESRALNAPEGWRLITNPVGDRPFAASATTGLLGPMWTQGTVGADLSDGDPNVYQYNEPVAGNRDNGFVAVPNLTATMQVGRSYALYAFADDDPFQAGTQGGFPKTIADLGLSQYTDTPLPVTFTSSGSVSNDGWNIVGNPFNETLNWDGPGWTRTNLDNVLYVYDPALGVFLTWNGTTGSLGNGLLPPFQGFYVKAFATPTLVAPMSARTTGGTFHGVDGLPLEEPAAFSTAPAVVAFRAEALIGEAAVADQTFVMFAAEGAVERDPFDAYKLAPYAATYLTAHTTAPGGTALDIHTRPLPDGPTEIPLDIRAVTAGGYTTAEVTLTWPEVRDVPAEWALTLVDTQTGATRDLRTTSSYTFTADGAGRPHDPLGGRAPHLVPPMPAPVDGEAGLLPPARFVLRIGAATGTAGGPEAGFALDAPRPNPFGGRGAAATTLTFRTDAAGPARLAVFDVLGREVARLVDGDLAAGAHTAALDAAGLAAGLYVVRLDHGGRVAVRTLTLAR